MSTDYLVHLVAEVIPITQVGISQLSIYLMSSIHIVFENRNPVYRFISFNSLAVAKMCYTRKER